jgi:sialidase-1
MLKCLRCLLVWSGCVWVGVPVFGQPEQTDVFSVGELGYKEHRIPSLVVTNQGTLLAFSESGITDSDYGNRDIRLRRSHDGGRSWSRDALTILDAGTSRTGSPCGFVDRKSGRVHFITAIDSRRVMHFQSDDDGRTWSNPRDITYAFDQFHERFKWTGLDPGPGEGIELERGDKLGRFIVPISLNSDEKTWHSAVIYSDDRGETWQAGGLSQPEFRSNEATVFEGADGRLHLNMRGGGMGKPREPYRVIAHSDDAGITWSKSRYDENLWTPQCHASTVRYSWPSVDGQSAGPHEGNIVLFAGAWHKAHRLNMTVLASFDDGKTWPVAKQIWPGPAAYCSIAKLPDGDIGLLYEGGYFKYNKMIFARFSIAWLLGQTDQIPLVNSVGMRLVSIPAGRFKMGSEEDDHPDRGQDESPTHWVQMTKPFRMSAHEVTQSQYQAVMGSNPSMTVDGRYPVTHVSWFDAVAFCRRLSAQENSTYRLPTEAEWEYACRAGTSTTFSVGPKLTREHANFGNGRFRFPGEYQPYVGRYAPNAWGLYDMHGNANEWCLDWYDPKYYGVSPEEAPRGPSAGDRRVQRGGSWLTLGSRANRSADRQHNWPATRSADVGFRVVLEE